MFQLVVSGGPLAWEGIEYNCCRSIEVQREDRNHGDRKICQILLTNFFDLMNVHSLKESMYKHKPDLRPYMKVTDEQLKGIA